MRLVLRDVSPGTRGAEDPPPLEDGRLTVGRPPESVVVERDGDGFVLVDTSRTGARVDGVDLGEGERVPLKDGSHIVVGDGQFRAEIEGEGRRGVFGIDSAPTISSILADVAPAGSTATGPVPGRVSEAALAERVVPRGHHDRRIDIGFGGDAGGGGALLPDDWNSDLASETEHVAAVSTRVAVRSAAPAAAPEPVARPAPSGGETALAAFLDGAGLRPGAVPGEPDEILRRAGRLLATLLRDAADAERDVVSLYEEHGVRRDAPETLDLADLLADEFSRGRMIVRLDEIRGDAAHARQAAAGVIGAASREWNPDVVAAKVDAARGRLPVGGAGRYWRAFVDSQTKDGRVVTLEARFAEALGRRAAARAGEDE